MMTKRSKKSTSALKVNFNSILLQDVHSMAHFPEESKITIYFNKQQDCAQPQLIGRFSEAALALVNWEKSYSLSVPPTGKKEGHLKAELSIMY